MSRYQPQEHRNALFQLSQDERRRPFTVLKKFFDETNLQEARQILKETKRTCLTTSEPPFDSPRKRDSLLYYWDKIEAVLEAAYLVVKRRKRSHRRMKKKEPMIHLN